MTSSFDPNNKYFVDVANPSAKSGRIRKSLGLDHFKTNFSLECKGDLNPSTEYDNQRTFQPISFGKTFDYVQQDKTFIHTVDTFIIPANSHEITYTLTPANNDTASAKYGRRININDSGGTAIWSFFGVACGAAFGIGTSNGMFNVELSKDGGSTYTHKKTFTTDVSTGNTPDVSFLFYDNLPLAEYTIKLTQLPGTILTQLSWVWYTTYSRQVGIEQYYYHSTTAKTITTDLPPCTFQFIGSGWTVLNQSDATGWSGVRCQASTNADYLEFYFYGSKVWINLAVSTDSDAVTTPLIDGATTYLKATTFSPLTVTNTDNSWIRIDNGKLPEGWHTLRVTKTSGVSKFLRPCGVAFYSANTQTTITKASICGKDSYSISADDAGLTYTGSWAALAEGASGLYRRLRQTNTNTDYVEFTTPADVNLKAIYLSTIIDTDRGNITTSLGGSSTNVRYLNLRSNNYAMQGSLLLLYDSFRDGALGNKVLRLTKVDGTTMAFEGLIFEIGDPCENGYLWTLPKLNHMRVTTDSAARNLKSNTYRLDVYGICTEGGNWAQPYCFSPWVNLGATTGYWRNGFWFYTGKDQFQLWFNHVVGSIPINSQARQADYQQFGFVSLPGVMGGALAADIQKLVIHPHRVI